MLLHLSAQSAHNIRSQTSGEQCMFECRFCFGKALSHFLADSVAVELVEVVNPALWSCFGLCLWGLSAGWHCFAVSFTRQIPQFKSTYVFHFLPYCLLFVYCLSCFFFLCFCVSDSVKWGVCGCLNPTIIFCCFYSIKTTSLRYMLMFFFKSIISYICTKFISSLNKICSNIKRFLLLSFFGFSF